MIRNQSGPVGDLGNPRKRQEVHHLGLLLENREIALETGMKARLSISCFSNRTLYNRIVKQTNVGSVAIVPITHSRRQSYRTYRLDMNSWER
jgi:hypothetical protein